MNRACGRRMLERRIFDLGGKDCRVVEWIGPAG